MSFLDDVSICWSLKIFMNFYWSHYVKSLINVSSFKGFTVVLLIFRSLCAVGSLLCHQLDPCCRIWQLQGTGMWFPFMTKSFSLIITPITVKSSNHAQLLYIYIYPSYFDPQLFMNILLMLFPSKLIFLSFSSHLVYNWLLILSKEVILFYFFIFNLNFWDI